MTYSGEAHLAGLLKRDRVNRDVTGVIDLIDGILASADGTSRTDWFDLLGTDVSDELKVELLAARAERAPSFWQAKDHFNAQDRLSRLRAYLAAKGIEGFVIPRADEHQGEYVPARAERLAWLTGFTGSAGAAVVMQNAAAIFVDGRYTIQVRQQVDRDLYEYRHLVDEPPVGWIHDHLKPGQKLAYDPWVHTVKQATQLREACEGVGAELVAIDPNPIDALWDHQPAMPVAPVRPQAMAHAGKSSHDKRMQIARSLSTLECEAAIISAPDSLAWLLNIRGGDVPQTPLALGYAIIFGDGSVDVFMDERKFPEESKNWLRGDANLRHPGELTAALRALGNISVRLDDATGADWFRLQLLDAGATVRVGRDPVALPKACKNEVELEGSRRAHCRDGQKIIRYFAWLENAVAQGDLDEEGAAAKLLALRAEDPLFRGSSFTTIPGSGPNGALCHYRCTPETNRKLQPGEIFLIDSGGQYLDGTTDITRTTIVGTPSDEHRDRFTRVLKGHIALARAIFPVGTTGQQLDTIARAPLWAAGLDYDHGTGHGVGSYLGVHEGPARISKAANTIALKPGMILSNEPGYYKEGEYGIRIENLMAVTEIKAPSGADRPMLGFETLTFSPIERRLIDVALLEDDELKWLNDYHAQVYGMYADDLDEDHRLWLQKATAPLCRPTA
ncbi:aminopeptidase P family protein [Thalassospira sp.]|uniref:aminopeptidase P family protein n=1 Tax=Thalassospira sp. TaxID=1912094 RepID=UPI002736E3BE|nr:aminopeptidase P family protein [Thalassospira sp.]MDP2698611.1 aminopeptidase P family protein [Thalassospira sp.]